MNLSQMNKWSYKLTKLEEKLGKKTRSKRLSPSARETYEKAREDIQKEFIATHGFVDAMYSHLYHLPKKEQKLFNKKLKSIEINRSSNFIEQFARDLEIVSILLEYNFKKQHPYTTNKQNFDIVEEAIESKCPIALKTVLLYHNPNFSNLKSAIKTGDEKLVDLICNKIDNDNRFTYGLEDSIMLNNAEMTKYFLEHGANAKGMMPNVGSLEVAREMIEHGANVNEVNSQGKTILNYLQEGYESNKSSYYMNVFASSKDGLTKYYTPQLKLFDYIVENGGKLSADQMKWRLGEEKDFLEGSAMNILKCLSEDATKFMKLSTSNFKDENFIENCKTALDIYCDNNKDKDLSELKKQIEIKIASENEKINNSKTQKDLDN